MMNMLKEKVISFVIILTFLILNFAIVSAMSMGAPDVKCAKCHKSMAGVAKLKIKGLPSEFYVPGKSYEVEITLISNIKSTGFSQGGFAFYASAGELKVVDSKNTMLAIRGPYKYITHTSEGNGMRTWKLIWQAPKKPTEVTIQISSIASNGDASPSNDAMAVETITLKPKPTGKGMGYALIIIGIILLVFSIVYGRKR